MKFPTGLENVSYYARGPWSNYNDRKQGSYFGLYTSTVTDLYEPFARPQSTGNHEDLRFLTLMNEEGKGVRVETEGQVAFSLLHNDDKQLKTWKHQWEVRPDADVWAHVDYVQKCLGNGSCGPAPLDKYLVPSSGTFTNKLRFTPIDLVVDGISNAPIDLSGFRITHNDKQAVIEGKLPAQTQASLFNAGGLRLATASAAAPSARLMLPLKDLPKGIYIIHVKTP